MQVVGGSNPLAPTISKNKGSLIKKEALYFLRLGDDGTEREVHEIAGTISPGAILNSFCWPAQRAYTMEGIRNPVKTIAYWMPGQARHDEMNIDV